MLNNHNHSVEKLSVKLFFSIILNLSITIAEIIGGLLSNSLALLSDAVHNMSDTVSIVLTYVSLKISRKPNTIKYTFGFKRIEILSALINAAALWVISIFLLLHAYERLQHPAPINSKLMFIVAVIGLLANLISVLLLHRHSHDSLNVKSAYLHLLGDTFSSVGVIAGSILLYFYKIAWIDPVVTILIVIYILKESWSIIKETLHILMQGAPVNIDLTELQKNINEICGVKNIHHTHIWMLSEKDIFLETHIKVDDIPISQTENITEKIQTILNSKYNINHITIQYEQKDCK
ncbi:MAG TPA: cation diffusion facilitator family transporter [bacterium]|nr:cation diffusion facilitator family transporter [bacterium]